MAGLRLRHETGEESRPCRSLRRRPPSDRRQNRQHVLTPMALGRLDSHDRVGTPVGGFADEAQSVCFAGDDQRIAVEGVDGLDEVRRRHVEHGVDLALVLGGLSGGDTVALAFLDRLEGGSAEVDQPLLFVRRVLPPLDRGRRSGLRGLHGGALRRGGQNVDRLELDEVADRLRYGPRRSAPSGVVPMVAGPDTPQGFFAALLIADADVEATMAHQAFAVVGVGDVELRAVLDRFPIRLSIDHRRVTDRRIVHIVGVRGVVVDERSAHRWARVEAECTLRIGLVSRRLRPPRLGTGPARQAVFGLARHLGEAHGDVSGRRAPLGKPARDVAFAVDTDGRAGGQGHVLCLRSRRLQRGRWLRPRRSRRRSPRAPKAPHWQRSARPHRLRHRAPSRAARRSRRGPP